MNSSKILGMLGFLGCAVVATACASEAGQRGDAPEATDDALEVATEGTTYNGWSQNPYGTYNGCYDMLVGYNEFTRTSGDATRGGGACLVNSTTTACTSDTSCLNNAHSLYGSSAYGYCYQSKCYYRPGSQSALCVIGGNWSPGTISKSVLPGYGYLDSTLGCMTKAAGPSADCGSTDSSKYMRYVGPTYASYQCASP